jgi:hypothetical protein
MSWEAFWWGYSIGILSSISAAIITTISVKYGYPALKKCLAVARALFNQAVSIIGSLFNWAGSKVSLLSRTAFLTGVKRAVTSFVLGVGGLVAGLLESGVVPIILALYVFGFMTADKNKGYAGYTAVASQTGACYCPTPTSNIYSTARIQPDWQQPRRSLSDCDRPSGIRARYQTGSASYTFNETPGLYSPAPKDRKNRRAVKSDIIEYPGTISPDPYGRYGIKASAPR